MNTKKDFKRIYMDYASTTPVDPAVFRSMKPYFTDKFHNPASLYAEGVKVKNILDNSRKEVATVLHALPDEIIFTGSGTESDNLAILGVVKASKKYFRRPHVVLSSIEHPGVLELVSEIKFMGGEVSIISPEKNGIVDFLKIKKVLKSNTILVSIMYANNEIGTIQPIKEIAKVIRFHRKSLSGRTAKLGYPYFHTDASQAANYCSLNVLQLGVDLLTLDGSKIYGPKGVGILFCKRGLDISPIISGGGQEKGLRSGTENIPFIVGFAKALSLAQEMKDKEVVRLTKLRDVTIKKIITKFSEASLNGDQQNRLPNNINICFKGIDSEFAVLKADALGILCSTASSCRNLSENSSSYVIKELGVGEKCGESSLRFTLGRFTNPEDLNKLIKILPEIISNNI